VSDQRQRDLALENARLRERLAELERRAVVAAPAGVRYGMDGMPHPTTTRRTFGRLIAGILFLLGIGLGFGFGSRRAIADVQAGVRDGWNEGGGAAAAPAMPPGK
jgi:hypothetical protein